MTANFGSTHYDWANMPVSYESYNDAQTNAVAVLMRHLGVSVEMYYDAESSGARQTLVPGAAAAIVPLRSYGASAHSERLRHRYVGRHDAQGD